jgi:hypothetical protein
MCTFNTYAQARVTVAGEHAFEGYKVVRVSRGGKYWTPTHAKMPAGGGRGYKPGKSYTAHAIPTVDMSGVGFHVFRTLASAKRACAPIHGVVRVKVYGVVVIHGDGYRAEYMDITGKSLTVQPQVKLRRV